MPRNSSLNWPRKSMRTGSPVAGQAMPMQVEMKRPGLSVVPPMPEATRVEESTALVSWSPANQNAILERFSWEQSHYPRQPK